MYTVTFKRDKYFSVEVYKFDNEAMAMKAADALVTLNQCGITYLEVAVSFPIYEPQKMMEWDDELKSLTTLSGESLSLIVEPA